jgi:hypothetical protein
MTRRTLPALAFAALAASGCADTLSSMTEHWFYGYVVGVADGEVCLDNARVEDLEAQRCFPIGDADLSGVQEQDLVKVRFEPEEAREDHTGRILEVEQVSSPR